MKKKIIIIAICVSIVVLYVVLSIAFVPCTNTYLSSKVETNQDKIEIINGRLNIDIPASIEVENFQNDVSCLYASLLCSEEDYKSIVNSNNILGHSLKSPTENTTYNSLKNPIKSFDWWGIEKEYISVAESIPICLKLRGLILIPYQYHTSAEYSVFFTQLPNGDYRMYCCYESYYMYELENKGLLPFYRYNT